MGILLNLGIPVAPLEHSASLQYERVPGEDMTVTKANAPCWEQSPGWQRLASAGFSVEEMIALLNTGVAPPAACFVQDTVEC